MKIHICDIAPVSGEYLRCVSVFLLQNTRSFNNPRPNLVKHRDYRLTGAVNK